MSESGKAPAIAKGDKTFVLLGGFNHEGVWTQVKALGYTLATPNMAKVSPKTWQKRAGELRELADKGRLAATALFLHTHLFLDASRARYRDAFNEIVAEMKRSKAIIFVFQDALDKIFAMRDFETGELLSLS